MTCHHLTSSFDTAWIVALQVSLHFGVRVLRLAVNYWNKREITRLYQLERMAEIERRAGIPTLPPNPYDRSPILTGLQHTK